MKYQTALIKAPKKADDQVRHPDGLTQDIIETVLYADTKAAWYTQLFAPTLKRKTLIETCRAIWQFVKGEIPYKVDPAGEQWVKSPGRLWKDKQGDCKSFSIFTGSCLKNLGIPYGYRFASYGDTDTPTHVYVYVPLASGGEIVLDSVWSGPFNTQKKYTFKQDHLMTRIAYLGSIGKPPVKRAATKPKPAHVPTEFRLTKDYDEISEGEMDLLIARQRLEIERANSAAVGGPFNWQIAKYDKAIGLIQHALDNVDRPEKIIAIGAAMDARALAAGRDKSIGSFFKKIGKGIAKGFKAVVKTVAKVVTFVPKLIAKGILEIYLPKAAMMFLYLFAAENLLTDKMRAKRKKAQKFKDFIVKKIGMKEAHFMGIVRNSLTKKLKMSPENFLSKSLKSVAVKGIGSIGYAYAKQRVNTQKHIGSIVSTQSIQNIATSAKNAAGSIKTFANSLTKGDVVGAVMAAISWIIGKLGGKKEGVDMSANDYPDLEGDAGNAFNYGDLNENYGSLDPNTRMVVKDQATEMINQNMNYEQAYNRIQQNMPYLNPAQQREIAQEVEEGFEPIDDQEGAAKARAIKMQRADTLEELYRTGGRSGPGMCKC